MIELVLYHVRHPLQFRPVYEAVLISVKHSEGFPGKENENKLLLLLTQANPSWTNNKQEYFLFLQSGDMKTVEDDKNISNVGHK